MGYNMNVGSLFAGIGGFDLAAENVGMNVLWQSEVDDHASQVLAHHWPHVPNYGDIHDIRQPHSVDVLTGGFPCQDYSVAGHREGLSGDRGALWWQYHRLISELRPTWILGENVPGLISSRDGADFETIIRSLTQLGYGVVWAILDSQYFGVAQRRRRVFIVGHSGGQPRPEICALSEGLYGHPEPSRTTGEEVAGTLAPGSQTGGQRSTDLDGNGAWIIEPETGQGADLKARPTTTAPTLTQVGQEHDRGVRIVTPYRKATKFGHDKGFERWEQDELANGLNTQGDTGGNVAVTSAVTSSWYKGPSGGGDGRPIVTTPSVRRLTPLECERLQGFPDQWTDTPGNSDTQRYRQLGNAVTVPVAQYLLQQIKDAA